MKGLERFVLKQWQRVTRKWPLYYINLRASKCKVKKENKNKNKTNKNRRIKQKDERNLYIV